VQTFIRFVQGVSVVSGDINAECTDLFASRLAPTGDHRQSRICERQKSNVGASLLAMASDQAT